MITDYQIKPLITFLYDDVTELITMLMSRFVKTKCFENADFKKLKSFDFENEENLKPYSSIQSGYLVEEKVQKALNDKKMRDILCTFIQSSMQTDVFEADHKVAQ